MEGCLVLLHLCQMVARSTGVVCAGGSSGHRESWLRAVGAWVVLGCSNSVVEEIRIEAEEAWDSGEGIGDSSGADQFYHVSVVW